MSKFKYVEDLREKITVNRGVDKEKHPAKKEIVVRGEKMLYFNETYTLIRIKK